MKGKIITVDLINEAISLVKPCIVKILNTKKAVWGPKTVRIVVCIPRIPMCSYIVQGKNLEWNSNWPGLSDFDIIATKKAQTSAREKMNTGLLLNQPWKLEEGEYLYAGGVYREGISVGVSGAKEYADEGIAEIIVSAIIMLSRIEAKERILKKENQI